MAMTATKTPPRHSLRTILSRAVRLRCPACGKGRLFRSHFRMHEKCSECDYHFDRGGGYWLGAIYVNYGLTAVIVTAAYLTLFFTHALPDDQLLWPLAIFTLLFPLWSFPYARSVWLGLDLYFDPEQTGESKQNYPRREDETQPPDAG